MNMQGFDFDDHTMRVAPKLDFNSSNALPFHGNRRSYFPWKYAMDNQHIVIHA
jgi:hypothetical protein